MISDRNSSFRFIVSLVFIGFIMPVIAFGLINTFFYEQNAATTIQAFKNLTDTAAQNLATRYDNSEFWCHELNRAFATAKSGAAFEASLKNLSEKHRQKIRWIIWNADCHVVSRNIASKHSGSVWNRVGKILQATSKRWYLDLERADDTFIRNVLGEHLQTRTFSRATYRNNPSLNALSFFSSSGSFWADFNDNTGAIVLFPTGVEAKNHGIIEFINRFDRQGCNIAIGKESFFYSDMPGQTPESLITLQDSFAARAPIVRESKTHSYTGRYVGKDLFFCLFKKAATGISAGQQTLLFSLILAFIWMLVLDRMLRSKASSSLSIRYVVIGIITCSNVFPILVMAVLGQQYLAQKEQILIEERRNEAVGFLRQIEEEFVASTDKIRSFASHQVDELGKILQHEALTPENTENFRKNMGNVTGKFLVVASTTYPAMSDSVFMSKERSFTFDTADESTELSLEFIETGDRSQADRVKINQTLSKCVGAFVAFYNDTNLSEKVLTEVELVVETVFQTKMHETFHKFLRLLDHVEHIGMGAEKHPTFMHVLSFNSEKLADYLCMFHFNQRAHAKNYMSGMRPLFQRNLHGIKVVYAQGQNLKSLEIAPYTEKMQLRELFARQTYFPQPQIELIELASQTWISTGFTSRIIADNSLIALSPIDEIQRRLSTEKQQLLMIMLINILLVAGITLVFVQTIIRPVALLQRGTAAIRKRDFSFRIPFTGKDEFGKMARVFNSALMDLEEMSLARDVQQQLFPKQQIETGEYDLFCKTVTMADLGGDYLDVVPLDNDRFVMILGDVAGHGVGAAMIMAMAKSAMLNSGDILDQPGELLGRLHDLIYRAKSKKQKKIMTFQYVLVDSKDHKVIYSNAGGCNPFIFRSEKQAVEELVVPGPALGSFKNARFNQCKIDLAPGDSIILYTDGLVESRNDQGEEIGYDKFKDMLQAHHSEVSQEYYERIMLANKVWRQNQPPQDDYSLMILGRRASPLSD